MGKYLKIILRFGVFWKIFSLILAIFYLFVWSAQFFNMSLFIKLDGNFGSFSNWFNMIHPLRYRILNIQTYLGYIFCSLVFIVNFLVVFIFEKAIQKKYLLHQKKQTEAKIRKINQKKEEELIKQKPFIPNLTKFYGFFDLKLELLKPNEAQIDLTRLKNEYFKIILKNLEPKYPTFKFKIGNKLFLFCDDFSLVDALLEDILKLFNVFKELDDKKKITTDYLLSFEAGSDNSNLEFIFKVLSRVNNFQKYNEIIVLDKFAEKYKKNKIKKFHLNQLGIKKIEMENFNDINVEMYQMKQK